MADQELFHGDYRESLDNVRDVNLFFTSPPYNIGSAGPAILGDRKNGVYDVKSFKGITGYPDNLPEDEYQRSQQDFLRWCVERLAPNGAIVYNHKIRHRKGVCVKPEQWIMPLVEEGLIAQFDEVVWDRGGTHNHTPAYVYQHTERLYVLCRGGETPHFKNAPLDPGWKGCSDVWRMKPAHGNDHDAPFPLEMAMHVLRLWSRPGDLVCDPYAGSGTTMIAAFLLGRLFVGSEMMKDYHAMAIRWLAEEKEEAENA